METFAFTKKRHRINNIISYRRWIVLAKQNFEITTGKLLVKNPSKKRVGLDGHHFCFVFLLVFVFAVAFVIVVCLCVCLFVFLS